jgi:hypothetical protein
VTLPKLKTHKFKKAIEEFYSGAFIPYDFSYPLNRIARDTLYSIEKEIEIIQSDFTESIKGVNVHAFFCNRDNYNARCTVEDNEDFIVVHKGCISVTYEILCRMFSFDNLNIIREKIQIENQTQFSYKEIIKKEFHLFNELEDKSSQFIIEETSINCLRFLFHHELAHLWNGHTGRQKKKGKNEISEIKSSTEDLSNEEILKSFSMEIDADNKSTHWLIAFQKMAVISETGKIFFFKEINSFPYLLILNKIIFSIYVSLRILCFVEKFQPQKPPKSISSKFRLSWAMGDCVNNLTFMSNIDDSLIHFLVKDISTRAEKAFATQLEMNISIYLISISSRNLNYPEDQ